VPLTTKVVLSAESRALARYALVITGGVFAWFTSRLLDHEVEALDASFKALAWAPALATLFFGARFLALLYGVKRVAKYVRLVESAFELPNGLGWETHLERGRKRIMFCTAIACWAVPLAVTVIAPFFIEFR
jgi:hypothetical protein